MEWPVCSDGSRAFRGSGLSSDSKDQRRAWHPLCLINLKAAAHLRWRNSKDVSSTVQTGTWIGSYWNIQVDWLGVAKGEERRNVFWSTASSAHSRGWYRAEARLSVWFEHAITELRRSPIGPSGQRCLEYWVPDTEKGVVLTRRWMYCLKGGDRHPLSSPPFKLRRPASNYGG
jgi:hypothetical protein